jgi:transposase
MESTVIAVDLAKSIFEIAVSRSPGVVSERHRIGRKEFASFFGNRHAAIVLLEACASSHDWARKIARFGHQVLLIPPHQVRRYVNGNKTDRADAKALLEAYRNAEIRFVPVKSEAHQGVAGLHCLRSGWMATRTARINETRGLLREFGHILPAGASRFVERAGKIVGDLGNNVPAPLRSGLDLVLAEIVDLERRIAAIETAIRAVAKETPVIQRLLSIPGVGLLSATAAWASITDATRFPSGRHLAKSLGLTPREHSSGNRRWLGHITKRGDTYLRMLLIHGGRSVVQAATKKKIPSRLEAWAIDRAKAIGHNRAAVGVANKLARLIWAVWTKGVDYQPQAA